MLLLRFGWEFQAEELHKLGSEVSLHWSFSRFYTSHPQLERYCPGLRNVLVAFRGPLLSLEEVQALVACPRLTALRVTPSDQDEEVTPRHVCLCLPEPRCLLASSRPAVSCVCSLRP